MKFGHLLLAYFMIGGLLWAGGLIGWGDAGVAGVVVSSPDDPSVGDETAANVENSRNVFQQAAKAAGGGALLAVVNIIGSFLEFLGWPIFILGVLDAPAPVQVVLGGGITTGFLAAFARFARGI